ncbi:MAG TPA: CusA/CzcA family heavy metal efflux RND transporter, partial [Bacteroidia bacterium]|nr:CusA/CzcA family heavy metal efflux RND transporter [Bacteroidia bacterium]
MPKAYGSPELIPPTTGLGEIFQYTLAVDSAHRGKYNEMDLRTIQDWIVKRQLLGVAGVVEVSSFGGKLKQYEVAVDPDKLVSMNISILQVYQALSSNNENTGGSYIDKGPNIYFIRGEGLINSLHDIENIIVTKLNGMPVLVKDIARVQFGFAPRYGAMTRNGNGETVGGVVLMMKGENSVRVIKDVKDRMKQVERTLPEGVTVDVFVDRTKLISSTIGTVEHNLFMGAVIVIFVLVLMLGNLRAGLIVASVIPLAMLFAIILMNLFGISANLMSMGALDFGLIVDGAVIVVESMMFLLHDKFKNQVLDQNQMDKQVISSSSKIMSSAVFGQFIILIVYVPIFALVGIEGKMFQPMALTVSFAIIGALILSITYVPLMSSLFLSKNIKVDESLSERFIKRIQNFYEPSLRYFLRHRIAVLVAAIFLLCSSIFLFSTLGGEFIPELDEGDFATNFTIRQGSSLPQSIVVATQLENILMKNFPEVTETVSKIGSSEIPTDPMPIESGDLIILLKDKKEWTSAQDKEDLAEKMNEKLSVIPGVNLSFEQPIQMRFNELIAGVKSDIAIKIYGDNLETLFNKANQAAQLISNISGAADIKVEQIVGMPQLVVKWNRERIAQFGLNIELVNKVLNSALAGGKTGVVYEGEKKFDLVVRYANYRDADISKVKNIFVPLEDGTQIPISQLGDISFKSAPAQISRDNGERRIVVEVNARNRDIQSVATDIANKLNTDLKLPSGYYIEYGGTFKNLQEAKGRLIVAVPVALFLILLLLFLTFRSIKESLIIFSAIPLAAIGGVLALYLRDMNFSISAGIGFIALFGVAVLNGIVLVAYFNRLEQEGETDITKRILKGTAARLRPVLATAAVASLGFLPMALSTSVGSE